MRRAIGTLTGKKCGGIHCLRTDLHCHSVRFVQRERKKVKQPRTADEIRRQQLQSDPSGLLSKAVAAESSFYQQQGAVDFSKLDDDSTKPRKQMDDDEDSVSSSFAPTFSMGFKYDYHPLASYPKRETMTLDTLFYVYRNKKTGHRIHIREGPKARVNYILKDLTADEILQLLRKPALYKLFPEDLLDVKYGDLITRVGKEFLNGSRAEAKRLNYCRKLLQHWWLQIKGKPPLKIAATEFI